MELMITAFNTNIGVDETPRCTMEFIVNNIEIMEQIHKALREGTKIRLEIDKPKNAIVIGGK